MSAWENQRDGTPPEAPAVLNCLMLGGHARHSATDNKHLVMLNEVTDRLTRDAPLS